LPKIKGVAAGFRAFCDIVLGRFAEILLVKAGFASILCRFAGLGPAV